MSTTAIDTTEPQFPDAPSLAAPSEADLIRQRKDRFRLFTRVLLTYLKAKDPELQLQVRFIIKDCKAKHVRKVVGYESVTESMRRRIKLVVGENYWKRAEQHFLRYLNKNQGDAHFSD
jgi:predicted nucleic acid-binding OB-fold protein